MPSLVDLDAKLCYAYRYQAYFTTKSLDEQWGDDWDDAPLEHNAGPPYGHVYGTDEPDVGEGVIYVLGYYGGGIESVDNFAGERFSVQQVNKRLSPWLVSNAWGSNPVPFFAGQTIREFIDFVQTAGGVVLLPSIPNE